VKTPLEQTAKQHQGILPTNPEKSKSTIKTLTKFTETALGNVKNPQKKHLKINEVSDEQKITVVPLNCGNS
jgi:hypothetical protein